MATTISLFKIIILIVRFLIIHANQFQTSDKCMCGHPSQTSDFIKILDGKEVKPHRFPWMAIITYFKKVHCGGSLINDKYILTAAHCFPELLKNDIQVYLGIHDLKSITKGFAKPEPIKSIHIHKDFTWKKKYPDIALMKLEKHVIFSDRIQPICLPGNDQTTLPAQVAGWGRLFENGVTAKKLQYTNLTIITNAKCQKHKQLRNDVNSFTMCAYGGSKDACEGDSGGPLMIEKKLQGLRPRFYWEQVGIVSWGIGCGRKNMPGIYARVYTLLDWIAEHTKDALYCKKPVINTLK